MLIMKTIFNPANPLIMIIMVQAIAFASTDADYSAALQTHFAKGALGASEKSRPIEMFFQSVSKNGGVYSVSGKSKTSAAEDPFNGTLSISGKTAGGSCKGGETELTGDYDLTEKESKTSGRFVGAFTACEKNGKLSKAEFVGNWVKHSTGNKTPCNFKLESDVPIIADAGAIRVEDAKYTIGKDAFERNAAGVLMFTDKDGRPLTGVISSYHLNMNVFSVKDGLRDGIERTYYTGGIIFRDINYKNGKQDGLTITYHSNRKVKSVSPYKDGKQEGMAKSYYESGKLETEFPYRNGLADGVAKRYYESGQLQEEISYKNNIRDGLEKEYHKNGKPYREVPWKNGEQNGLTKSYYESGKIKSEEPYKNGKQEGQEKHYYENGKIEREVPNKGGCVDGLIKDYYESGKLKSEFPYENCAPNGLAKSYYESGQIKEEMLYEDEMLISGARISETGKRTPLTAKEISNANER
jgi:antitoxin component YwqK of YwqJK toxin-antitoxin module